MSQLLEFKKGANSLIAAYDALEQGGKLADQNDVAAVYEQYFVTAVPPASVQPPVFEKVSLVDPTIRTFIRSTTAPV